MADSLFSHPDLTSGIAGQPRKILDDMKLPDGTPMLGSDGYLIPPAREFSMIVNGVSRIYSYRFDEAMRDNWVAARAMWRDAFILGLVEERILPTINRRWQIEVPNAADQAQRYVQDQMTKIIDSIPDFDAYRRALLNGVWFGRAGVQQTYSRDPLLDNRWGIPKWSPVHGDSIQFTFDGVPAVLMDAMTAGWYAHRGATRGPWGDLRPTDRGGMALVLHRPYWRDRFVIHQHIRQQADFFEGELAGSVQGLGLRGQVYWQYVVRTDALTWMLTYMQSVGQMDMLIFNYPTGNEAARQQQLANANKIIGKAAIVVPRNPAGNWAAVEQLSMNDAGLKALHDLIAEYFDRHIERLIVGQSMSAGLGGPGGLEGDGRADFARACVPVEGSEILTRDGFKQPEDVQVGEFVLAYDPETDRCRWTPLLKKSFYEDAPVEKLIADQSEFMALCTPDHSWAVEKAAVSGGERSLKKAYDIGQWDNIILAAAEDETTESLLTPTEAAILGRAVTRRPDVESANKKKTRSFSVGAKTRAAEPQQAGVDLLAKCGFSSRADLPCIVTRLSPPARAAMLDAMADGNEVGAFFHTDPHVLEAFAILCALQGKAADRYACGRGIRREDAGRTDVWCPTTKYGTWVMRQNGRVMITGNTKDEILVYDTNRLDNVLTRDLIRPLMRFNFKWAKFPVKFKSILPNLEGPQKVEAGGMLVSLGVPIKMDEIRENAGYSRPEDGDEIVGGMPPMPQGGGDPNALPPDGGNGGPPQELPPGMGPAGPSEGPPGPLVPFSGGDSGERPTRYGRGNSPIRYGQFRGREEWQPFVEEMYREREGRSGIDLNRLHANSRGVLADFLDDVGDPRGVIVRRAAEPNPKLDETLVSLWPNNYSINSHVIRFPHDGTTGTVIPVRHWEKPDTEPPTHVRMGWFTPAGPKKLQLGHFGTHTPEEARDFADLLPDEQARPLHTFLDQHFGPRQETPPTGYARRGRLTRYNDGLKLLQFVQNHPNQLDARAAYADWLQENGQADADTLDLIANHPGPIWADVSPSGRHVAGRVWTMPEIRKHANDAGSHWFTRDTMRTFGTRLGKAFNGPGGTYFVTVENDGTGRDYNVRKFNPVPKEHESLIETVGADGTLRNYDPHETMADAVAHAKTLAATHPPESPPVDSSAPPAQYDGAPAGGPALGFPGGGNTYLPKFRGDETDEVRLTRYDADENTEGSTLPPQFPPIQKFVVRRPWMEGAKPTVHDTIHEAIEQKRRNYEETGEPGGNIEFAYADGSRRPLFTSVGGGFWHYAPNGNPVNDYRVERSQRGKTRHAYLAKDDPRVINIGKIHSVVDDLRPGNMPADNGEHIHPEVWKRVAEAADSAYRTEDMTPFAALYDHLSEHYGDTPYIEDVLSLLKMHLNASGINYGNYEHSTAVQYGADNVGDVFNEEFGKLAHTLGAPDAEHFAGQNHFGYLKQLARGDDELAHDVATHLLWGNDGESPLGNDYDNSRSLWDRFRGQARHAVSNFATMRDRGSRNPNAARSFTDVGINDAEAEWEPAESSRLVAPDAASRRREAERQRKARGRAADPQREREINRASGARVRAARAQSPSDEIVAEILRHVDRRGPMPLSDLIKFTRTPAGRIRDALEWGQQQGLVQTAQVKTGKFGPARLVVSRPTKEGGQYARKESPTAYRDGPHKFGCAMVDLTGVAAASILALGKRIPDESLCLEEGGREDRPHVTILYGLHEGTDADAARILAGYGMIRGQLTTVSVFPGGEDSDYDVVKADVESDDLRLLNYRLRALPHTNKYPEYKPHATIAYVKKGEGARWASLVPSLNVPFEADVVTLSTPSGERRTVATCDPVRYGRGRNNLFPVDENEPEDYIARNAAPVNYAGAVPEDDSVSPQPSAKPFGGTYGTETWNPTPHPTSDPSVVARRDSDPLWGYHRGKIGYGGYPIENWQDRHMEGKPSNHQVILRSQVVKDSPPAPNSFTALRFGFDGPGHYGNVPEGFAPYEPRDAAEHADVELTNRGMVGGEGAGLLSPNHPESERGHDSSFDFRRISGRTPWSASEFPLQDLIQFAAPHDPYRLLAASVLTGNRHALPPLVNLLRQRDNPAGWSPVWSALDKQMASRPGPNLDPGVVLRRVDEIARLSAKHSQDPSGHAAIASGAYPDLSGWTTETTRDLGPLYGQRDVTVRDPDGNVESRSSGTRKADEQLIRDAAARRHDWTGYLALSDHMEENGLPQYAQLLRTELANVLPHLQHKPTRKNRRF